MGFGTSIRRVCTSAWPVEPPIDCRSSKRSYLPVWFGPSGWDADGGARRRDCAKIDRDTLASELSAQAVALRADGYEIAVVILDASLT